MAVYTPLSQKDIETFLAHYDAGALASFKGITEGVENTNYLVILRRAQARAQEDLLSLEKDPVLTPCGVPQDDKNYILTLYEKRVNPDDLPFFLGLTEWLAQRGIPCPRPVQGRDGRVVYMVKDRPAALIEFLKGQGSPHITPRHLELVGELMARLHLAAEGFTLSRRNALGPEGWERLFTRFSDRAGEIAPGLAGDIAAEVEFLRKNWPRNLPSGVIHADIFPDNVFFIDGHTDQPELTGIIDFYFACNDFWMYDLMICMNAWCFDAGHRFVPERARALVASYHAVRPITDAESLSMPTLGRGAAMRFLVTRSHDWLHRAKGALVNPKNPMEYVAKLKFHQSVQDWRDYGVL